MTTNMTKTLDEVSVELTGKPYKALPDDGSQQDYVMGEFEKMTNDSVFLEWIKTQIIAIPDDRPPEVCSRPLSFAGTIWGYMEPNPQQARRALEIHAEEYPDREPSADLVRLADLDGVLSAQKRLIAASPELLEALEKIVVGLSRESVEKQEKNQNLYFLCEVLREIAETAIKKAKGE